jgi:hypothetical protein
MTTDTATLPVLAEAMSVRDLRAWEVHLEKMVGTAKAQVDIHFGGRYRKAAYCFVTIEPTGEYKHASNGSVDGPDWPSAILAAQTWIANRPKVERNAVIRKLALAVIECTDEHGKCTVAMLRAKGFDADEIALHAEACVRAGEMANCAPFVVEGV